MYSCNCAVVRCASSSLLPPRGDSPFADPPGEFLFFLYHPFRRHFCFCAGSAASRRLWRAALGDGIRYRSTGEAAEAGGGCLNEAQRASALPAEGAARGGRAASMPEGESRSQPFLALGIALSRCLPAVPRGLVGIALSVLE